MSAGASFDGELEKYRKYLSGMASKAKNPTPLLEEAGKTYKLSFSPQIFRSLGAVDGHDEWAALKEPTRGGKNKRAGGRPLNDTGRFRDSVDYRVVGGTSLEVGTVLKSKDGYPFPAVHQYGSTNTLNKDGTMRIPKREWLFFTVAFLQKIGRRWAEMLGAQ